MADHTPLPWANESGLRISAPGHRVGGFVALVATLEHRKGETPAEQRANGAFIVRACNAHDELLAALKVALKAGTCPCCGRDNSAYPDYGCTADDCPGVSAITKAKG